MVALVEVLSDPELLPDADPYWVDPPEQDTVAPRVRLRLWTPPSLPWYLPDPVLEDLNVAKGQALCTKITREQWPEVLEAVGGWPTEAGLVSDAVLRGRMGQGFQHDVARRSAVELWAMKLAVEHYRRAGWEVEDTSAFRPYDLSCRRGGEAIRVEVKGTETDGERIRLTRNEVRNAREHRTELFVVRQIQVRTEPASPIPYGGVAAVWSPWRIDDGDLLPAQYDYAPSRSDRTDLNL